MEKGLDNLKFLKSKRGLFTDEREVDDYLARKNDQEKDMVISRSYVVTSPTFQKLILCIFRIQSTGPEKDKGDRRSLVNLE